MVTFHQSFASIIKNLLDKLLLMTKEERIKKRKVDSL